MSKFTDTKDRQWTLTLNVPVMRAVREQTGTHLGKLLQNNNQLLIELLADPIAFVDCLATMTAEQRKQRDVTDVDFGESMIGDVFQEAHYAFLEALADFCPGPEYKSVTLMLGAIRKMTQNELERVSKVSVSDLVEEMMKNKKNATSTTSVLSMPEQSELSQEKIRLANSR